MNRLQEIANFLIIVVLGAILLIEGAFILVPLVWGVFFAFALYPVSSWIERKRIPRGLAIFSSILIVGLVSFGVFYLLINQMVGLIKEIPEIGNNLEEKLGRYIDELSLLVGKDLVDPGNKFSLLPSGNFNQTILATGKSLTLAGIVPLFTFLLMYYKDFFIEFLVRFSSKNKELILNWATDSGHIIQSYLAGIIRVTGIVALMAGLFFYLMGIKYFILFALFIAIMNLIPYVGVFISSFFVILYVFLTTDSLFPPVLTFAVLWGIQLLENNLITPLVVGSKVRVNALAVILAILLGGWLWGISGMVLFIPLVGVLKITLERSQSLNAFGYLLGDDIPISEEKENFWILLQKRIQKK
ncbi:MAG: AI-2E family transporter [Algoriphagus sp.]|jgi:predicted PurR-regulated permease PerM|uniref:AI-2E family transporter n=1 Tax=Algoriphagus sp. TaxID=1872435 RepID=UPI0027169D2B|nr:AI-2E family transporter [Algoriphagus sp.]MDO8965211.1 AI-2E family transporter [Algoriphagus sp.]MDP2039692.1 AI-2E family transporter [Algoriphagus sp.]MDP3199002.1 AI-2E family transporter [Algoriphagus sp.]MDP3474328.1 AI-2E family transporter [Algoriphagus sp.]